MIKILQDIERRSRPFLITLSLVFLAVVGIIDYLTGFEISFSVFYIAGVGLAVWFVGRGFGFVLSVLSVAVWMAGDLAAGAKYSSPLIPVWNAAVLLAFYCIMVWLLATVRSFSKKLEIRVQQRTLALTREMAERERLEKELLEVSEREQRRIGRDLHDSLCQHLTGTALAGQVLEEKLSAKALPEAADANKIVELVEAGIMMARNLARGIYPVEMEAEGLMAALQELATHSTQRSKVACVFEHASPVFIDDATTATHLYRIAQEAVSNALRHSQATRIVINLSEQNGQVTLTVTDNGVGLPDGWQSGEGLGTRIMAHRAAMSGAAFAMAPNPAGGTRVTCSLANARLYRHNGPTENDT